MTKKRFARTLITLSIAVIPWMVFAGCGSGQAPLSAVKILGSGETWEVAEVTRLTELTIAEDAAITAPEGHSVTLTVNGVETPIKIGRYEGNVVLTVAEDIVITASVFGDVSTYQMRAAIDVEDGVYRVEKSVPAAVTGGSVTDSVATDVKITSIGENFNGIIVQGDSTYTIESPEINFTGYGGNDFAGYGAAVMTEGNADVTVNGASIKTKGAIRSAAVARGSSILRVNDSDIEVQNGALPEGYVFHWSNPNGVSLMMVPWMLGITGNCRATNLIESATAYYTNTHIKAQGWGCLSTDGVKNVNLFAKDCHIETVDSGYGSYADGSSNHFSGCTFDVADYALIMSGGTGTFTDHCTVNSGRFGVMFHGAGNLTIDEGSEFNTGKAVLQVKSARPSIVVDNAVLTSKSGLILQAMLNDDPNMGGSGAAGAPTPTASNASAAGGMPPGGGMPEGGMPEGGGARGGMPEGGAPPQGGMPSGAGGTGGSGGAPMGMPGGPGGGSSQAMATFRNMTMTGDIVTSMTSLTDLVVAFENTILTGAVTTAVAEHAIGPNGEKLVMQDETDLYYLIGEINETYSATDDKYGIKLSLDGKSTWIVDKTSYLTELSLADGCVVQAPKGYNLTLMVNGKKMPVGPGSYNGKIVLLIEEAA